MKGSHEGHLVVSFLACLCLLSVSLGFARNAKFAPLEFPVRAPGDVARVAAFVPSGNGAEASDGADLVVRDRLERMRVVSPANGAVKAVRVVEDASPTAPGRMRVHVEIVVNHEWSVVLSFEPSTADTRIKTAQVDAILVTAGQTVAAGDDVGDLVAGELGNSRLRYTVLCNGRPICPRSCSSKTARDFFDAIAARRPPVRLTAASPGD